MLDRLIQHGIGTKVVKGVQSGMVRLPYDKTFIDVNIGTVNLSSAYLKFNFITGSTEFGKALVKGQFISENTIRFSRGVAGTIIQNYVDIRWEIVEYVNAKVQRGSTIFNTTAIDITTSPFKLSKSFIDISWSTTDISNTSAYVGHIGAFLYSTNRIQLSGSVTMPREVEWQIIELN